MLIISQSCLYLSTAALGQSQALDLSLQGAQLLPEPGLPSVQTLLHLLLAIHVLPVALALHLPHLLVTVVLVARQTALEAIQDLSPHAIQLGVQDLIEMSGGAGAGDGTASGSVQQPLQLSIMAQDHSLKTHTGEEERSIKVKKSVQIYQLDFCAQYLNLLEDVSLGSKLIAHFCHSPR